MRRRCLFVSDDEKKASFRGLQRLEIKKGGKMIFLLCAVFSMVVTVLILRNITLEEKIYAEGYQDGYNDGKKIVIEAQNTWKIMDNYTGVW